ncbi:nitroreductase family deazaflavin-dependent oxidoreductase [Mycobacterium sp. 29Ha]|uniref:nitroreductase family deazaflavin-dependent oxidoreductase n=1 Tax=Mycobacterium sp. 29Ha TaxID=2939268 RepID=UPI00293930C8|nr:nitroreductase family deazaflavin-dependent oxidoreductase [Mycobacterium sp. 29Ha]MDV3133894.1 nitroreductase family deazaflavin-dependent oxidoreductase [Mycobacterium sp. 29Ha]
MRVVAVIIGTLFGAVLVLLGLLVAGMRWQVSPVVNTVRRMNRSLTNPRVMRTAGNAGTQTSVIEHIGRRSGKTYETPVDIIETTTRLLIALPYGARTDWLRNVLAAGSATVVSGGERIPVERPAVVATTDVEELIPVRTLRLFGVSECLSLEKS